MDTQCKSEPIGVSGYLMFMPGGMQELHLDRYGRERRTICVDRVAALVLQDQLETSNSQGKQRSFFDFDHDGEAAVSGWPLHIFWSDIPRPGVYAAAVWNEVGIRAIKENRYRYFSPMFNVDTNGNVRATYKPPLNFGGLVNYPGFRKMPPLLWEGLDIFTLHTVAQRAKAASKEIRARLDETLAVIRRCVHLQDDCDALATISRLLAVVGILETAPAASTGDTTGSTIPECEAITIDPATSKEREKSAAIDRFLRVLRLRTLARIGDELAFVRTLLQLHQALHTQAT